MLIKVIVDIIVASDEKTKVSKKMCCKKGCKHGLRNKPILTDDVLCVENILI